MRIQLEVTEKDIARVRSFFDQWAKSPMVVRRAERNVNGKRAQLTERTLWHAIVTCQLTTQQRSGPQSPITKLMRIEPFPLSLDTARAQRDVGRWATDVLSKHGGIRRYNQLSDEIATNLQNLDARDFAVLLRELRPLEKGTSKSAERDAAHLLDRLLAGVGPKQARNILQSLGLSQFEIPLDSRVAKWLRGIGFPLPVAAAALSDSTYYDFALDAFQEMSQAVGVLPCLLDAAIFASFDRAWSEEEVVW